MLRVFSSVFLIATTISQQLLPSVLIIYSHNTNRPKEVLQNTYQTDCHIQKSLYDLRQTVQPICIDVPEL